MRCVPLEWYSASVSPHSVGLTTGDLVLICMSLDKGDKKEYQSFSLARYYIGDLGRGYWVESGEPNRPIEQPMWPVTSWMLLDTNPGASS